MKTGTFILGALAIGLLATASAAASDDARFDYYYIVANEDGSSGGHTAIRLGDDVYHFQAEDGLLVLHRDEIAAFLRSYTLLGNRTIYSTTVAVSQDTFDRIVNGFRRRLLAGEAQLGVEATLLRDHALLVALRDRARNAGSSAPVEQYSVRGLGYFERPRQSTSKPSESIASLRHALLETYGAGFLDERRDSTENGLRELLGEDPTEWPIGTPRSVYEHPPFSRSFSDRWSDLLTALAALDVLDDAPALAAGSYHAPIEDVFVLSPEETEALQRYARKLEGELVDLAAAERADWGRPLLVGMARLIALHRSIESGRLVFLDTYPEELGELGYTVFDRRVDLSPMMVEENEKQLNESRVHFRDTVNAGELAWERVEERSNRYLEILRAYDEDAELRVARGHLVPTRAAPYPATRVTMSDRQWSSEQVRRSRERLRAYSKRVRELHGYHLIAQNCSTAIFETLNDAFDDSPTLASENLGGYIDSRNSWSFVPFVSARQVDDRYRVVRRETYSSYRLRRLAEMREDESSLWIALRESNAFTADAYRGSSRDSFFVFFTDDAMLFRPLFGAVNLAAAVGQSAVGLVMAPLDRSATLLRGLRGAFVSLPELAFSNIRKGSYDWVPPDYRQDAFRRTAD